MPSKKRLKTVIGFTKMEIDADNEKKNSYKQWRNSVIKESREET